MAIVREREVGTLEQLNVTPLARWELIVGKLLPYAAIGLFDLGLGLFVSTISQTQHQASMTATFFFLTPMIYLSGFTFPIENMPGWIQWVT